jgi:hypothetical protein
LPYCKLVDPHLTPCLGHLASSGLMRDKKWVTKVQELDQVLVVALRAAAV